MIEASELCDFYGALNDVEKYGFKIEKPMLTDENEGKSIEELKREKSLAEFEEKILSEINSACLIQRPSLKQREGTC